MNVVIERVGMANSDSLQVLKDRLLDELVKLSPNMAGTPQERFNVCLTLARSSGSTEMFEQAFKCAQEIDNESEKADAMLSLLDEVDIQMDSENQAVTTNVETDQPGQQTELEKTEQQGEDSQTEHPQQEEQQMDQPVEMPQEQPAQDAQPQ